MSSALLIYKFKDHKVVVDEEVWRMNADDDILSQPLNTV
jgi:hypothetical protein